MDKYILAVDHGTSGVKCALMTTRGQLIGHASRETPLILLPGGGAEQDPDAWWNAFLTSAKELVDQGLVPPENIVSVCVSAQWSTTVAVDKEGNHLMNAVSWLDTRGAPHIKKAVKGIFNIEGYSIKNIMQFYKKTAGGPGLAGKDPTSHILFIKNERPEVYAKTDKFLECKDFMNLKLTGKAMATFDSIIVHWVTDNRDLANIHYDDGLIKSFKMDKAKLPPLIKATDVVGELLADVAREIGLPPGVKVFGGSGDLQAATIGSGATRNYETHVYLGTSSFLICHVPFMKLDMIHKIASIPSANPEKYFVAIEQETAGGVLSFLRDNILSRYIDMQGTLDYKDIDTLAEKVPAGSENLIFAPWLYGERAPVEDGTIRGGLFNVSLRHTADHVCKAALEGVAYNSRWVLGYLEKFVGGRRLDPIAIIGGGAVSDIWCQIYADVLQRTMRRPKDPKWANARGAAFIAAVGMGEIMFDQIPDFTEIEREFVPNKENFEIYNMLFDEFVNIYGKMKDICKRLNTSGKASI
ncbi:MAG TPA: FGGY-family carbohydrate kinase [Candidatus Lokiarchaeia archaeon]|nr:FGGY-family carbohydrate kinase [Candidatus Lokiarchaeia archaeon]